MSPEIAENDIYRHAIADSCGQVNLDPFMALPKVCLVQLGLSISISKLALFQRIIKVRNSNNTLLHVQTPFVPRKRSDLWQTLHPEYLLPHTMTT